MLLENSIYYFCNAIKPIRTLIVYNENTKVTTKKNSGSCMKNIMLPFVSTQKGS